MGIQVNGEVVLVAANGAQFSKRDSVLVALQGTLRSTLTDSIGHWQLPDLTTGIYTVVFSKAGFGTTESVQLQFIGNGNRSLGLVYLCQPPSDSFGSIQVRTAKDTLSVYLTVRLADTSVVASYRTFVFVGNDSSVSRLTSAWTNLSQNNTEFVHGVDSATVRLQRPFFATGGFVPGNTVWIAAYLANAGSNNSGFTDTLTGRTVYTNLNPVRSNVLKVVVP